MSSGEKSAKCPVCKYHETEQYVSKSFENLRASWLRCEKCGTLFISPLPAEQELAKYYRRNYKKRKSPGSVSHCFRYSEENKNMIFNEYELSLSDIGISEGMLHNKKLLDYGCANGLFLDFCFERGCFKDNLFGYEIAEDLFKEVREKNYNILSDEKNFFDYIFLWDVLEHITNPKALLRSLKLHLVAGGGGIIVQTPRVGILSDSLKDKWEHFLPFEHVILYTRKSLVKIFNDVGFQLLKISSFGANAPLNVIPQPYKNAFDNIAKQTDNGSTQVAYFVSN